MHLVRREAVEAGVRDVAGARDVEAGAAREAVEEGLEGLARAVLPASLAREMRAALPGLLASPVSLVPRASAGRVDVAAGERAMRAVSVAMMVLPAREDVEEGASSSAMMAPAGGKWVDGVSFAPPQLSLI